MAFFFFGTLMDHDVLERVLGRSIQHCELAPARLPGYRRIRASNKPYPVLIPDLKRAVEGLLLPCPNAREERRIAFFEEGEYIAAWRKVHLQSGEMVPARVFLALPRLGVSEEPWDLVLWARAHKAEFLRLCDQWMRACPD